MDLPGVVVAIIALVAVATLLGLANARRVGRVRHAGDTARIVRPDDLRDEAGGVPTFGTNATIVQFSTEMCARCPATRRMLGDVATRAEGVTHLDVDLTRRKDLADRFAVTQTPTILILDAHGAARTRIGGAPQRAVVIAELEALSV